MLRIFHGIPSECQTVGIQNRLDNLLRLELGTNVFATVSRGQNRSQEGSVKNPKSVKRQIEREGTSKFREFMFPAT